MVNDRYQYKGNKAGAVATGFFAGGASFLLMGVLMIFFVVAPEGAPRNIKQDNVLSDQERKLADRIFELLHKRGGGMNSMPCR